MRGIRGAKGQRCEGDEPTRARAGQSNGCPTHREGIRRQRRSFFQFFSIVSIETADLSRVLLGVGGLVGLVRNGSLDLEVFSVVRRNERQFLCRPFLSVLNHA